MIMLCERCKYWELYVKAEDDDTIEIVGFCHRYPPSQREKGDEFWDLPCTYNTQWCGEFSPILRKLINPARRKHFK